MCACRSTACLLHTILFHLTLSCFTLLALTLHQQIDRRVLEVLREPIESGRVAISRAARQVEFPAKFQLVAAMNPCHCGYLGHHSGRCRCTPDQVSRYRSKISGPLQDRIDLQIEVAGIAVDAMQGARACESSEVVRARVIAARQRQLDVYI